ncbi:organic hydroperoxide resistance protein OhrR [soil metagenome]
MQTIANVIYTANATAVNGRNGHARSSDGALDVSLAAPAALGGTGKTGTNPEHLFAAGYAACFIGAMQYQAGQKKIRTGDISIDSQVEIGPASDGKGFALAVTLNVSVAELDDAAAKELVAAAHETCPYSNATRGNIQVTLNAKGGK